MSQIVPSSINSRKTGNSSIVCGYDYSEFEMVGFSLLGVFFGWVVSIHSRQVKVISRGFSK